jgi:hypothetical protein
MTLVRDNVSCSTAGPKDARTASFSKSAGSKTPSRILILALACLGRLSNLSKLRKPDPDSSPFPCVGKHTVVFGLTGMPVGLGT